MVIITSMEHGIYRNSSKQCNAFFLIHESCIVIVSET